MKFNDRFHKPFFSLTADGDQRLLLSVLIPMDPIGKRLTLDAEPHLRNEEGILYVDFVLVAGNPNMPFLTRDFPIDLTQHREPKCAIMRVWDNSSSPAQILGSSVAYCGYADSNRKNAFTPYLHVYIVPKTGIYSVGFHVPLAQGDNYLVKKVNDNRLSTDPRTQYAVRNFEIEFAQTTTYVPYLFEEIAFQKIDKDFEMWIEVNSTINDQGSKGTVAHGDADEKPGPEISR